MQVAETGATIGHRPLSGEVHLLPVSQQNRTAG